MSCKKKSHPLCGAFCLNFIALVVFKNSCLTDYLFCVGLGKVKPSFTDQKKFELNKIQMARADCKQIVSQWAYNGSMWQNCYFWMYACSRRDVVK